MKGHGMWVFLCKLVISGLDFLKVLFILNKGVIFNEELIFYFLEKGTVGVVVGSLDSINSI